MTTIENEKLALEIGARGGTRTPGNEAAQQPVALNSPRGEAPRDNNSFELAGTSFMSVQVQPRLASRLPQKVRVTAVFQYRMIADLAQHLGEAAGTEKTQAQASRHRAMRQRGAMSRTQSPRPNGTHRRTFSHVANHP